MRILDLADKLGEDVISAYGDLSYAPAGIANDHRKTAPGGLFVCVKGYVADGHDFAAGALENGAAVLVAQRGLEELGIPSELSGSVRAFMRVKDTRRALAAAAQLFYKEPTKKLMLAGVTGTKGKTTAAHMIRAILNAAGMQCGLLGTVENDIGGEILPARETTPESLDLAVLFDKMVRRSCTHAVMEVSSQGLALSRVDYCDYDIGVFTNFSNDHISPREHGSPEEYLAAKLKLFGMCKKAVVNADIQEYGAVRDAFVKNGGNGSLVFAYSADETCENRRAACVRASKIEPVRNGKPHTRFYAETPWFTGELIVGLPGRYNVSNALAAITVCGLFGIPEEAIRDGLRSVGVRGRTQTVEAYEAGEAGEPCRVSEALEAGEANRAGGDITVLVDYAHNAASLEATLKMLREYDYRSVTTVFGCGGDRARDRRFAMGEVSGRYSDFTVVTSDNPRSEDPARIMADIEFGLRRTAGRYIMIQDRREAIGYAINNASAGELVLIAGKGHETVQINGDRAIPFDDAQIAREYLRALAK